MALKELKVIEVEVGEYRAFVEDGQVTQDLPKPTKTADGLRDYRQFIDEVLEAKERTKPMGKEKKR